MDFLVGFIEWGAVGRTTRIAEYSFLNPWFLGNIYLIITLISIICSIITLFIF